MLQELTEQFEKTARAVVNEIHTALPGNIVSFDAEKGLAIVKPIGKYVTSNNKFLEYPEISEVPLVFPYSSQTEVGICFPVKIGDSCIIIISEVELDEWRNGAESEGSLRFDLTNAIAIPGLLQTGNSFISESVEKEAVIIATSDSKLLVSKGSVEMTIGNTQIMASKLGTTVRGDFKVEGNISYTGTLKRLE